MPKCPYCNASVPADFKNPETGEYEGNTMYNHLVDCAEHDKFFGLADE